ncbi:MAG: glycosyltransferase family A protein [Halioglobus sp.]
MQISEAHGAWRISVVIPLYNGASHIGEALDSVFAQAWPDLEVIVVDDGSTDDSAAVVQAYPAPVTLLRQANSGSGAARNRGVAAATGELLAFLDADDLWAPDKLQRQTACFEARPELDVVWGRVREFQHGRAPEDSDTPTFGGGHPGSALMRIEAFHRCGGFPLDLRQTEVIEWASRMRAAHLEQCTLDAVVMYRRLHPGNKGRVNPANKREYLQALKRHINRQRT